VAIGGRSGGGSDNSVGGMGGGAGSADGREAGVLPFTKGLLL
jgi:hypothetical protein